ncbi:MAG: hypothetical protein JWR32_1160 [Mycobacterium sp.]|nr:hypothetical protein [Mycobacterium sp.]
MATYRYLRLGMVVLIIFLAASIFFAARSATCLQSTISDYYFTTAHPVFVGAICALGACLIVYQGSSNSEDALLNFSGVLAFIVALVPATRPKVCGPELPDSYDAAVGANVGALLVAAAVAVLIYLPIKASAAGRRRTTPAASSPAMGGWARFFDWLQRILPWLLAVVVLVGVVCFFAVPRAQFERHAHLTAAIAMFIGIIVVVVLNAVYASQRSDRQRRGHVWVTAVYIAIAVLMLATLVAAIFVHARYGPQWKRWGVIALESALILEFLVYWAVQTADWWKVPDYRCVLPPEQKVAIR